MSVGREEILSLLGGLLSPVAEEREEAADGVVDFAASYSPLEARFIARNLALLSSVEENGGAREAQLHALSEIFDESYMDLHDIALIFTISETAMGPSEREYIDGLREVVLARARRG